MIPDDPLFDPDDHALTEHERELTQRARALGQNVFAARAARFDREARFPTENYRDLHAAGLLAICVPREHGGEGASFRAYMLSAAEIGRYCGATALTWNMHVCSTLWTGPLTDDLGLDTATQALQRELSRGRQGLPAYGELVERTKEAVGRTIFQATQRRPLIMPIIAEV